MPHGPRLWTVNPVTKMSERDVTNLEFKLLVSPNRGRRNLSKCSNCGKALIEFVYPTLIQNELLSRPLPEVWQASDDTSK